MTPDDLAAIRARAEAATEGPWSPVVGASGESFWVEHPSTADVANEVVRWRDAEFIAHARTDVPALLAEVERLTSEETYWRNTANAALGVLNRAHLREDKAKAERDALAAKIGRIEATLDRWRLWAQTPTSPGILSVPIRDVVHDLDAALADPKEEA